MPNGTLQNIRSAIDQDLNSFAWRFGTASDPQSGLVKNIVDSIYGAVHRIIVIGQGICLATCMAKA